MNQSKENKKKNNQQIKKLKNEKADGWFGFSIGLILISFSIFFLASSFIIRQEEGQPKLTWENITRGEILTFFFSSLLLALSLFLIISGWKKVQKNHKLLEEFE